MKAPETDEAFCQWYEDCWADRDEVEYPKLFGAISEEVYTLERDGALEAWLESDLAEVKELDPNWAGMGVRVAPPSPEYPYWTYVTAGCPTPSRWPRARSSTPRRPAAWATRWSSTRPRRRSGRCSGCWT